MDTSTMAISIGSFDTAPRQSAVDGSISEAKKTFKDLRGTLTEEQIKKETSRCLGCGCVVIDEDLCVGCGICTTKCKFDAIKLEKTIDNVGKTYYRTLMQAATNTPLAVGRLAKKKLGAVKK
jgi:ferredoxin